MFLNNLKISTKLLILLSAIVLANVADATIGYTHLATLARSRVLNQNSNHIHREVTHLEMSLLNQQAAVRAYLISADPTFLEAYRSAVQIFDDTYAIVQRLVADDTKRRDQLAAMHAIAASWQHDLAEREIDLMAKPETHQQALAFAASAGLSKATQAREAIESLMTGEEHAQDEQFAVAEKGKDLSLILLLSSALVSIGTAIAAGWMLSRSIARPVCSLTTAMNRLASGDLGVEIPDSDRRDEIGQMAGAMIGFKAAAVAKTSLEEQALAQNRVAEAARLQAEDEAEAAAGRQAQVVEALANGLAQLAEGNLTFVLTDAFAPEYDRLRVDFNAAVEGLQDAMLGIIAHSQAIAGGSTEIASATEDLARRTEQQAASLEQTAAALDEITATVQQTASGSGHAQSVAATTKADATKSDAVVTEAVAAMGAIEGSARQIGQIIGVIDEIAFQTNLLALNAGVEAARAGEAGRGFAVVASEVRALAQRAADAAKEIKALVTTSMQQVERGVRLVGETGTALGRIQSGVNEINHAIVEIAASAAEQASGLAQVNSAINEMDQVTQKNAAMVEESTAAARSLARETEDLNRAITRFRVVESKPSRRHAA